MFSLHSTTRHNLDAMTLSSPPCFAVLVRSIHQNHNSHYTAKPRCLYSHASGCFACSTVSMIFPTPPPFIAVLPHHHTPFFSPSSGHTGKEDQSRSNVGRENTPE